MICTIDLFILTSGNFTIVKIEIIERLKKRALIMFLVKTFYCKKISFF